MRTFKKNQQLGILLLALSLFLPFQHCSKVAVSDLGEDASKIGIDDPTGGQGDPTFRNVTTSSLLKAEDSPLDIMLVIDNSGSMDADSAHLADRLENFVSALGASGVNWQMCLIRTDLALTNGAPQNWAGTSSKILNAQTANLGTKFRDTISAMSFGGNNTGDERGIAALSKSLDSRNSHGCYRQGSVVTTIVISDEDERSMGGIKSIYEGIISSQQISNQYKVLEAIDEPVNLLSKFNSALTSNKLLSNSIVVRSNDNACFTAQNAQDTPAFYGKKYEELSSLTGGSVGSICATDYAPVLSQFATVILKSYKNVELECVPHGPIQVISSNPALKYTLSGKTVSFEAELQADLAITIKYVCKE